MFATFILVCIAVHYSAIFPKGSALYVEGEADGDESAAFNTMASVCSKIVVVTLFIIDCRCQKYRGSSRTLFSLAPVSQKFTIL